MTNPELTSKQLKFLKSRAHELKPVVRVGQHGLSAAVIKELDIALAYHELVKIKVAADDRESRASILVSMSERTKSQVVQQIGSMVVLYRRNDKKPVINLSLANSN